jgi:hypothetical protein
VMFALSVNAAPETTAAGNRPPLMATASAVPGVRPLEKNQRPPATGVVLDRTRLLLAGMALVGLATAARRAASRATES